MRHIVKALILLQAMTSLLALCGCRGRCRDSAPTVAITAPAHGATVSGTIIIIASPSDDKGISKVEFSIDGMLEHTAAAPPYTCSWDTSGVSNACHAITATAYDTRNQTTDTVIMVTVNNAVDESLRGWELTDNNTGLAGVGIDKNSLPLYSDPIAAGSTISMKKLVQPDLSAGGITFDRCWIVVTSNPTSISPSASGSLTILDCDIEGLPMASSGYGSTGFTEGVGSASTNTLTVVRTNITGFGAGFNISGPGTIQQTYIHDLAPVSAGAEINHVDGCTRRSGTAQLNVIDCRIDAYTNPNHTSSTVFLQDNGGFFDNILFQGNLFENGSLGGSVVLENKEGNGYGTGLIMDNNRFAPKSGDEGAVDPVPGYGYTSNYGHGGNLGWGQWTNNYINHPGNPDNKGAVMLEPPK